MNSGQSPSLLRIVLVFFTGCYSSSGYAIGNQQRSVFAAAGFIPRQSVATGHCCARKEDRDWNSKAPALKVYYLDLNYSSTLIKTNA